MLNEGKASSRRKWRKERRQKKKETGLWGQCQILTYKEVGLTRLDIRKSGVRWHKQTEIINGTGWYKQLLGHNLVWSVMVANMIKRLPYAGTQIAAAWAQPHRQHCGARLLSIPRICSVVRPTCQWATKFWTDNALRPFFSRRRPLIPLQLTRWLVETSGHLEKKTIRWTYEAVL